MSVTIKEVKSRLELKAFISFPEKLYKYCPYWVNALWSDEYKTLLKSENPAFEYCEAWYFLAEREGKIAGRVAAIINHNANRDWQVKNMRFGWLDFVDDIEVSGALLGKVEELAYEKGMTAVNGPFGFTDMDREGMLIEGFAELGTLATIYNHEYYPLHTTRAGYGKDVDWLEYEVKNDGEIPEKYLKISKIVSERLKLRSVRLESKKQLLKYAPQIFDVLNEGFAPLYGFTPLTPKQVEYYIKMYFAFVVKDFISIVVDTDDQVVAFGITMPSLSKAMQKSGGKLFPFGFLHILRAMKRNDTIDFYLMAVKPSLQGKGVNAMLFVDLIPRYKAFGITKTETNVELESNELVRRQWEDYERRQHKRRRAFIKKLN